MSVALTWSSVNSALATSINIYRSTAPIDVNNLPTPLANIAGTSTTYTDTTAALNTVYYYVVGMVRLGQELLSPMIIMGHYHDTGPGPQTLLRGTWLLGYFGLVPVASMLTPTQLNAQIPIPGTRTADVTVTGYHKFIRNGKILFIPNYYFTTSVQPYQLYNAGLLMGTNDNGQFPFVLSSGSMNNYTAPANQYKVATVGVYQFIVRSPKVSDKPTTSYVVLPADTYPSEWTDLICRMGQTSLAASPQDKWLDLTAVGGWYTWTQQWTTSSQMCNTVTSPNLDNVTSLPVGSGFAQIGNWLPVLELILT